MAISGVKSVKSRMRSITSDIASNKAVQFVNAVGAQAGVLSKEKAPLEYGALHNSQRFDVTKGNGYVVGTLSYNTMYASILNDGVYKWNPRPPDKKAGPAWNPNATTHFLEYGFESNEAKAMINKFLKVFKI